MMYPWRARCTTCERLPTYLWASTWASLWEIIRRELLEIRAATLRTDRILNPLTDTHDLSLFFIRNLIDPLKLTRERDGCGYWLLIIHANLLSISSTRHDAILRHYYFIMHHATVPAIACLTSFSLKYLYGFWIMLAIRIIKTYFHYFVMGVIFILTVCDRNVRFLANRKNWLILRLCESSRENWIWILPYSFILQRRSASKDT